MKPATLIAATAFAVAAFGVAHADTSLDNIFIMRDALRQSPMVTETGISGWHQRLDVRLRSRIDATQGDRLAQTVCDRLHNAALGWTIRILWTDGTVIAECKPSYDHN
jgi:hypothetical protein